MGKDEGPAATAASSGLVEEPGADVGALDADRFRELYPSLRRFAAAVADHDIDPDDLLHDALAGLLRQPPAQVSDPAAYLRRSMIFGVSHHRRSRARARARTAPPVSTQREDDYPSVVWSLLEVIAPRDRALLYLLDVEGWTMADAANAVGIPVGRAKARASRARRAARAVLSQEKDDDDRH